jgi:alpha-D-ribose 1-methylphosphonate 5-triphosphate synthase subunit PhnG
VEDETLPGDEAGIDRARRCELLAATDLDPLLQVADRCLAGADQPQPIVGPEVGSVVMTVREPVEATRFHLGDVLVTRFEVLHREHRGWAMRPGDDRAGAVAAAICDAECEADGPGRAEVEALCDRTEERLTAERAEEWQDLAPTVVSFQEMGE